MVLHAHSTSRIHCKAFLPIPKSIPSHTWAKLFHNCSKTPDFEESLCLVNGHFIGKAVELLQSLPSHCQLYLGVFLKYLSIAPPLLGIKDIRCDKRSRPCVFRVGSLDGARKSSSVATDEDYREVVQS